MACCVILFFWLLRRRHHHPPRVPRVHIASWCGKCPRGESNNFNFISESESLLYWRSHLHHSHSPVHHTNRWVPWAGGLNSTNSSQTLDKNDNGWHILCIVGGFSISSSPLTIPILHFQLDRNSCGLMMITITTSNTTPCRGSSSSTSLFSCWSYSQNRNHHPFSSFPHSLQPSTSVTNFN